MTFLARQLRTDRCALQSRFQPPIFLNHEAVTVGRPIKAIRFTGPIVLLCIFLLYSSRATAQASTLIIPSSTVRQCGVKSAPFEAEQDGVDALSILKNAASQMDPHHIYDGIKQFDVSGDIVDSGALTDNVRQAGTFHTSEDHSIPHGDYVHAFNIDGKQGLRTRTNGHESLSAKADAESTGGKVLPFIPKSFQFPLAELEDIITNPSVSAHVITNRGYFPSDIQFKGLRHIRVVDQSTAATRLFGVEDWYFDEKTSLPLLVGHLLPVTQDSIGRGAPLCVEAFTLFSDYDVVSDLYIPKTITHRVPTALRSEKVRTLVLKYSAN